MANEIIRSLIADDGYAISFQSLGQYRSALLDELDKTSGQTNPIDEKELIDLDASLRVTANSLDHFGQCHVVPPSLLRRAAAFILKQDARISELEALLADAIEPVGEGPSNNELDALERQHWEPTGVVSEALQKEELFNYRTFARAILARWARPAALPAQGEVEELVAVLQVEARSEDICSTATVITGAELRRAATLLEKQETRIADLRSALRECGLAVGSLIQKDCSDSFLLHVPGEIRLVMARPVPPAPEVGELVADLSEIAQILCGMEKHRWAAKLTRAATLLSQLSAPAPAVVPVAVEALTRLYRWGGMQEGGGYDSNVVLGVRHWIAGGMVGDLPRLPRWIADRCPPLPQGGEGEA